MRVINTLVLVHAPPKVLLGMKKRGFGKGRWNGFGGKVKEGESIEEAARREILEEAGVLVGNLEKRGILEFHFRGKPLIVEMHIFRATDFYGEPLESEEMRPTWFETSDLPYKDMWSADKFWFPVFLEDIPFTARVHFDENDQVIEHLIEKRPQFSFL